MNLQYACALLCGVPKPCHLAHVCRPMPPVPPPSPSPPPPPPALGPLGAWDNPRLVPTIPFVSSQIGVSCLPGAPRFVSAHVAMRWMNPAGLLSAHMPDGLPMQPTTLVAAGTAPASCSYTRASAAVFRWGARRGRRQPITAAAAAAAAGSQPRPCSPSHPQTHGFTNPCRRRLFANSSVSGTMFVSSCAFTSGDPVVSVISAPALDGPFTCVG